MNIHFLCTRFPIALFGLISKKTPSTKKLVGLQEKKLCEKDSALC